MKYLLPACCLLCFALGLPALADAPAKNTVEIHDFKFAPGTLTVHVGDSVTWINRDQTPHTVADADKTFRSAALDTDDKFTHAYTKTGTYKYFCTMHPQMTGTVTVLP